MRTRVRNLLVVVVLVGVIGGSGYLLLRRTTTLPTVPKWPTPMWVQYDNRHWLVAGFLSMRCGSMGCHQVLLRHLNRDERERFRDDGWSNASVSEKAIYGIGGMLRGPEIVSRDSWDRAVGDIIDCIDQVSSYPRPFEISADQLKFNDEIIPFAGESILKAAISQDGNYLAVLTAGGKQRFRGLPSIGSYTSPGMRIHQVFRMTDGKPATEPIVLDGASIEHNINPCWSPESRYVIYVDTYLTEMWIVPFLNKDRGAESHVGVGKGN